MTIYLLNLFILLLTYIFVFVVIGSFIKNKNKVRKIFVITFSIQLILLLSLRHISVGIDIENYLRYFQNSGGTEINDHRFEVGFLLLNKLIYIIAPFNQFYLFVLSTLIIAPVSVFIYKNSINTFLSFYIYITFNYFTFAFSGLRQAIALGFILLSYSYIKEKKIFPFLLLVVLASLFHQSALIFLPAYFIYKIELTKVFISIVVLLNIIIYVFRRPIFEFIILNFYDSYSIVETAAYSWLLLCLLILVALSLVYKNVRIIDNKSSGIYNLLLVGITIMMFASVGNNVMRVADYYYIFIIILLPLAISSIKDKGIKTLITYSSIVSLTIIYIWLLNGNPYNIIPYKFFWE